MAKKKKKSALNIPMLVIAAVSLVVFLTFSGLTVRNILIGEEPSDPGMEERRRGFDRLRYAAAQDVRQAFRAGRRRGVSA